MLGFRGRAPRVPSLEKVELKRRLDKTDERWHEQKEKSDAVLEEVERVQRMMEKHGPSRARSARPH